MFLNLSKNMLKPSVRRFAGKKAHPAVAKEIENHLIDQKTVYLEQGDSESIAEEKALLQMGDPVAVGAALDSTHKPSPQWGMIGLILLLCGIGIFLQLQYLPYSRCTGLRLSGIPAS